MGTYPVDAPFSSALVFPGGVACEAQAPALHKPRLLDQVRHAIEVRHYSRRTEDSYMICTHVLNRGPGGVRSPADQLMWSQAGEIRPSESRGLDRRPSDVTSKRRPLISKEMEQSTLT